MVAPATGGFDLAQRKQLPVWIADDQGQAFEATFGQAKDTELGLLKEAVKARWPTVGPDDALYFQGRDRDILQAPVETSAEYRLRLSAAPDLWNPWGGTPKGLEDRFNPYGLPSGTAVVSLDNWQITTDGNSDWFSRVFILVDSNVGTGAHWFTDGLWNDPGNWDDLGVWDSSATVADLDYLRKSIRAWKSAQSYPVWIAVLLIGGDNDGFWDFPAGLWGDPGDWTDSTLGLTYWRLGEVWGEEVWYGGGPSFWDEAGDVWSDFVAPSGGWSQLPFAL